MRSLTILSTAATLVLISACSDTSTRPEVDSALQAARIADQTTKIQGGQLADTHVEGCMVNGTLVEGGTITGTRKKDEIDCSGSSIGHTINGGGGNDHIIGSDQADIISGGAANDYIDGGGGNDILFGGVYTSPAASVLPSSTPATRGADDGTGTSRFVLFAEKGGSGDDTINGGLGNDVINGGSGDDVLHGNEGNDDIYGGNHSDKIFGDAGTDTLRGGHHNDELDGGPGDDACEGGAGNDTIDNCEP